LLAYSTTGEWCRARARASALPAATCSRVVCSHSAVAHRRMGMLHAAVEDATTAMRLLFRIPTFSQAIVEFSINSAVERIVKIVAGDVKAAVEVAVQEAKVAAEAKVREEAAAEEAAREARLSGARGSIVEASLGGGGADAAAAAAAGAAAPASGASSPIGSPSRAGAVTPASAVAAGGGGPSAPEEQQNDDDGDDGDASDGDAGGGGGDDDDDDDGGGGDAEENHGDGTDGGDHDDVVFSVARVPSPDGAPAASADVSAAAAAAAPGPEAEAAAAAAATAAAPAAEEELVEFDALMGAAPGGVASSSSSSDDDGGGAGGASAPKSRVPRRSKRAGAGSALTALNVRVIIRTARELAAMRSRNRHGVSQLLLDLLIERGISYMQLKQTVDAERELGSVCEVQVGVHARARRACLPAERNKLPLAARQPGGAVSPCDALSPSAAERICGGRLDSGARHVHACVQLRAHTRAIAFMRLRLHARADIFAHARAQMSARSLAHVSPARLENDG
jgi:hypothetical protein